MKIFFDYQIFAFQQFGGISRYFCELIKGINGVGEHEAHLSLLWSNNAHLEEYQMNKLIYPFGGKYSRLLHETNKLYSKIDFMVGNYDVYHSTYFDGYLNNSIKNKPYITTFYDMIYEKLSSRFVDLSADKYIIAQKREMAERATHIIAISESTKKDMVEILNLEPEKISVIYLGSSFQNKTFDTINVKQGKNYILYVGNRSGYKNFLPFLKSVQNILIKYDLKLICAGGGGFTNEEKALLKELSLSNLVESKVINDSTLPSLYKDAALFVFPSLYEGFGIPVLEAFSCGCPCVLSNTSSLPEVAGNAAVYFDPESIDDMERAIEQVIDNSVLREQLIERGFDRLKLFSWDRMVSETTDLYRKFT